MCMGKAGWGMCICMQELSIPLTYLQEIFPLEINPYAPVLNLSKVEMFCVPERHVVSRV